MLTLILKANNSCNLRCEYCSVGDKSDSKMMSESEMMYALEWFSKFARERKELNPAIIFHGGEPLLIPVKQYRNCIDKLFSENADLNFTLNIQTNGTILNNEIINLFKNYNINPGISIDGSESVHDSQRKTINGEKTFSKIINNIKTLKENEINVSTLMVLTRKSLFENLDYLKLFSELELPLKINPLYSAGEAVKHQELFLKSGEYAEYMIRVFEYLIDNEIQISLLPLEYILQAVIIGNTAPRGCIFSEKCSESFICVNQDGNIFPCGRFADDKLQILGNIYDGINKNGQQILKELKSIRTFKIRSECKNCKYKTLCNGGCIAMNGLMCNDYKKFLDYFYNDGLKKYKQYLLSRRAEILNTLKNAV